MKKIIEDLIAKYGKRLEVINKQHAFAEVHEDDLGMQLWEVRESEVSEFITELKGVYKNITYDS